MDLELKNPLFGIPPPHEKVRMVWYQTWPFSRTRYDGMAYSCGVAEWEDYLDISDTLKELGFRTWYKEVPYDG